MRRITLTLLLPCLAFFCHSVGTYAQKPTANWRAKASPEILAALDRGETVDLLVILKEQADLSGAQNLRGKSAKGQFVFGQLQAVADQSQANVRRILRERRAEANTLWLVNAVAVAHADRSLAQTLAALPEVSRLATDPWITFQMPEVEPSSAPTERNTIEWGVNIINAPAVWALGFSGQGITVGGADTGYDWAHPALFRHYRGWNDIDSLVEHNYNWHDGIKEPDPTIPDTLLNPCGIDLEAPCDDNSHGTHTMGTMTGDDGQGNQIGVAPGAKWIGCRNMDRGHGRPSTYLDCWQWFVAPTDLNDENPHPDQAPHVINNSWYCSYEEGCTDTFVNNLFRQAIIGMQAAGIVVVISNGNEGNHCATTNNPPAYFEESFSVGATRMDDTIARFSSRGPVIIDGSFRIKPNVSAPGQDVRSSTPNGNYANFSGTSMAGPHVVGLVALILSARPDLEGEVALIENIIEQTAIPKTDTAHCYIDGAARPNNAYGWGRVDALAAVNAALLVPTQQPLEQPVAVRVFPNPVQDEAIFELTLPAAASGGSLATLEIFTVGGQRIYAKNWAAQARELTRVSLNGRAPGLYVWRLRSEAGSVTGKLIKD